MELLTKYVAFDIDESVSIDPGWFIDSFLDMPDGGPDTPVI